MKDGWDSYFLYDVSTNAQDYVIASAGKDGSPQGTNVVLGPTTDFNQDIIFVDGQFMQFPDGIQQ
jgi:hypothetical protein